MNPAPIIFATSHEAKAKQMAKHLGYPVVHRKLDIDEIQSLDSIEVVTKKAQEAYRLVGSPVVVEDVSVRFRALGRLPGTYFKAFLGELGLGGLCKLVDGYDTREATVETSYAYCDGMTLEIFSASIEGEITDTPHGKAVFGSDAIFIPHGYTKTWSEMNEEELANTSVTTMALRELRVFLESKVR